MRADLTERKLPPSQPSRSSVVSRSGALPSQQRPSSRDLNTNRLAYPAFARGAGQARAPSTASTTSSDSRDPSRDQIAMSLGSKNASWFKQSSDRGIGSPALRKDTQVVGLGSSYQGQKYGLPGMREADTTKPEKQYDQDLEGERSASPSRGSSAFGDGSLHNRYSSISSASALGSPFPVLNSQSLKPKHEEPVYEEHSVTSERRYSPERSTSPTKGLGGFVQSAMMKRSDSVSKRWSAQPSQRLSRANSVASNRSSAQVSVADDAPSTVTGRNTGNEPLQSLPSRPGSSLSDATVVHAGETNHERSATQQAPITSSDTKTSGTPLPHAPSTGSSNKREQETEHRPQTPTTPFVSRTMDPKRWSPTKASWLESALNRPESPRQVKTPAQPSWARGRQTKASVDLGRSNSIKEVTPSAGLIRPSAPGSHHRGPSIQGPSNAGSLSQLSRDKGAGLDPAPDSKKSGPATSDDKKESSAPKDQDVPPPHSDKITKDKEVESDTPPESRSTDRLPVEDILAASSNGHAKKETIPDKETKQDAHPDETAEVKRQAPSVAPKPNITLPSGPSHGSTTSTGPPKTQSPAMDLRANLRRREVAKDNSPQQEPEFKNVFGRLRKAETKKYVPEDKFKENILKGKAELNVTGGPQKSQRVDEFKENILKQKEAMKSSGGSIRKNAGERPDEPKPAVPEAIARRINLARSDSAKNNHSAGSPSSTSPSSTATGTTLASSKTSEHTMSPTLRASKDRDTNISHPNSSVADRKASGSKASEENRNDSPTSRQTQKKDSGVKQNILAGAAVKAVPASPSENVTRATTATEGKLTSRINPALANLLSRGPPAGGGSPNRHPASLDKEGGSVASHGPSETQTPASLTHMTKHRARVPKRRPPKAIGASVPQTQKSTSPSLDIKKSRDISPLPSPSMQLAPAGGALTDHPKPRVASKPLGLAKNHEDKENKDSFSEGPSQQRHPHELKSGDIKDVSSNAPAVKPKPSFSRPTSVSKPEGPREDEDFDRTLIGATKKLNLSSNWSPSRTSESGMMSKKVDVPATPEKPILPPKPVTTPSPLPARKSSIQTPPSSSPPPSLPTSLKESKVSSPIISGSPQSHSTTATASLKKDSPLHKRITSPPVPRKSPSLTLRDSPSISPKPVPQSEDASDIISSFFKTKPKSSDRIGIDPQLVLESEAQDANARTLKVHVWEITGDGKMQDLPPNQEYILYEGSMYLCVHTFEGNGGSRTEAYLWRGDDVGEAALEDALLFARKTAKDNGCKLELIQQGKEVARFIQALGGIMITRRGPSSRSGSSALYMLCARRHLKQVVFDEVDYSRRKLCSGYPFVVSARFGKVYLWKGRGSGAEETGAARLIGMDLGLTGDFEEVNEGEEPEGFFENFPDYREEAEEGVKGHVDSEYWRLKPNHPHYHHRLLRFDHGLGRSGFWSRATSSSRPNDKVQEIEPFCKRDITPHDVYVLDTFFEVYVYVIFFFFFFFFWKTPGKFTRLIFILSYTES